VFVATAQLPICTLPVLQRRLYHGWLARGPERRVMTARTRMPMIDGMREVLDFWFDPSSQAHWFKPSAAFDQVVAARLGDLHRRAADGALEAWQSSALGCLALCILLDQAPRQLFRGEARAFATDDRARAVAELALAEGFDRELPAVQRLFLYLPLMHSERVADQERCIALFQAEELRDRLCHAVEHADIIRRFGRFPHRNAALGRPSTADEAAYLRQGGKWFDQVMPSSAEAEG
jgi:uncharacterized protein (DUF924 family)